MGTNVGKSVSVARMAELRKKEIDRQIEAVEKFRSFKVKPLVLAIHQISPHLWRL